MADAKRDKTVGRRGFLRTLGAGAGAVAAAPLAAGGAQALTPSEEEGRARYQESEQVKTFYRVNGYEK
jgi:hypothetical protein